MYMVMKCKRVKPSSRHLGFQRMYEKHDFKFSYRALNKVVLDNRSVGGLTNFSEALQSDVSEGWDIQELCSGKEIENE